MTELNKGSHRLLLCTLTLIIIITLTTGITFCKNALIEKENEFIGGVTLISVKVTKTWIPQNDHPDSIEVQLYRNGEPYGYAVTLDGGNSWSHTWTGLDANEEWSVDELHVPEGYTKRIDGNVADGFVITNSKDDDSPHPKPDPPKRPGTPDTENIPGPLPPKEGVDPPNPEQGQDPGGHPGSIPKTSDSADPVPWLIALVFSASMLRHILFFRKKRGKSEP